MNHSHHHQTQHTEPSAEGKQVLNTPALSQKELLKLSFSATFHCLIGCGIGEVAGMIIATAIGLNNLHSVLLSVLLGFVGGMALGIIPLKKQGFAFGAAFKTVLVGEGLSIAVMEAFEVGTELAIPGVMSAHLTDSIFWIGMAAALAVGFIAAFPVNYIFIERGVRHHH